MAEILVSSSKTRPQMCPSKSRARTLAFLLPMTCLFACGSVPPSTSRGPVTTSDITTAEAPDAFEALVADARARARGAYVAPRAIDPSGALAQLDYDMHRRIRFRAEASLFRGGDARFEAQFFHLGSTSRTPIDVFVVDEGRTAPYPYRASSFRFDDGALPRALEADAYSGFRLHANINTDAYRDEVIVFQGASYFRAVARSLAYGLSARGLAIDTGTSHAEEFPVFDAFHIVAPRADDSHVWVLASLTSPRAEGAYAFRIEPGAQTTVDVTAHVFVRDGIEVLGLAPLTSMYLFGEEGPARDGDFRPEVHDSDVLVTVGRTGEQLARPLRNPERTTVSTHRLDAPRGFGLLQRDRAFASYQDLEARYHERPSVWIEPVGDWGAGAIRLLEIATHLETDDNIAAMWVPDVVPDDGLAIRYRITFAADAALGTGARDGDAHRPHRRATRPLRRRLHGRVGLRRPRHRGRRDRDGRTRDRIARRAEPARRRRSRVVRGRRGSKRRRAPRLPRSR